MTQLVRSLREMSNDMSLGLIIVLTILFKFSIEFVYIVLLSSAEHFPLEFNLLKYTTGFVLTLGLTSMIFIQTQTRPIMRVAMTLFLVFTIIPILSYFGISNQTWIYSGLVVASFVIILQFSQIPVIDIRQRSIFTRQTTRILTSLIAVHTIVFYVLLMNWYGLPPISPLFFENTYEIRATTGPMYPTFRLFGSPAFGYLHNWQIKVFNLFLLGLFLINQKYRLAGIVGALAILIYMYSPNTLHIAAPILVVTILALFRYHRVMAGTLILGIFGVISGYFLFEFIGTIKLVYQVVGRALYVEARNDFISYQWFQLNPHIYLTDSPLNPLWKYPYDQRHTYLFAEQYLGSSHNATVGFLADAYGQLGAIGMLTTGVIVGAILWVLDSLASQSDPEIVLILATTAIFNFNQSDLTSNILTNGVALIIVISFIYVTTEPEINGLKEDTSD